MPSAQNAVIAIVVAICVVAVLRFELYCFSDLVHRNDQDLNHLPRTAWALAIALVIPVGGICYLYYGRPH